MRELRPEPRPMAGARAPLFERLAEVEGTAASGPAPPRVLDRAGLRTSILEGLAQLLNTRRPGGVPEGWVLDYGVPDFGGLSAASAPDREHYASALTAAIAAYEPRLLDARISLEPVAGDPQRLRGRLSGDLLLGSIREPVVFPLLLHAASGALQFGEDNAGEVTA
ncbi:MAG: type VI secretion system baseplate subunit TssE [Acidobacteria bacterium]|nr:MAG: type VI secretion system baseplate subunit TssE [Acidobacteriota bacterium]